MPPIHEHSSNMVYGVLSRGVMQNPHLEVLLGAPVRRLFPYGTKKPSDIQAIVVWGRKPSAQRAIQWANRYGHSVVTVEDGFLRSIGLAAHGCQALSLVKDRQGIYFDAHHPSALETYIIEAQTDHPRAQKNVSRIIDAQLSKYNHAPVCVLDKKTAENILVIDQTVGDQSVYGSGADAQTFMRMLDQACTQHPQATIWIKTHPEVVGGKKKGYLSQVSTDSRIQKITADMNPVALIEQMDAVYVVSSHMGFEALMVGKPVYCFGAAWYAGWGLTCDQHAPQRLLDRRSDHRRTLEDLFAAAYLRYSTYIDPITHQACDIEQVIDLLSVQKSWNDRLRGQVLALDFSPWKRKFMTQFLDLPSVKLRFSTSAARPSLANTDYVLLWGSRLVPASLNLQPEQVIRVEDGFIRSVGLGAYLNRPISLVFDLDGIYYNWHQPSKLEHLLNQTQLDPTQRQTAQHLMTYLITHQMSKYNVGQDQSSPMWSHEHRRKILVCGQVEDDASIVHGSVDIQTNQALLAKVRHNNPDACVIYKPHPDVVAGLRKGHISPDIVAQLADFEVRDMAMPACLAAVDEVHVLTSLTGFEALIRRIPTYCYGLPFYAGWGLTHDQHPHPRRNRHIDLETLAFCVLCLYPTYHVPSYRHMVDAPTAIREIALQKSRKPTLMQRILQLVVKIRVSFFHSTKLYK